LGYEEKAYVKGKEVLGIDPSFSLERFSKALP
jgi:hypothetical protein